MKVAIIGAGISGLVCAHLLHAEHDVTLFEAEARLGGHTNTVDVVLDDRVWPIDTGFIVFNERTYPGFVKLLARLGVASRQTRMTFSMTSQRTGIEWAGTSLDAVFAQRRNLANGAFLGMLGGVLRFNREATAWVRAGGGNESLGEWLGSRGFGAYFIEHYLVPLGAAVWSADPGRLLDIPARFFLGFFDNHGFLSVRNQPPWRVIDGGSRNYVEALVAPFRDRIRSGQAVERVTRASSHVEVNSAGGRVERFDQVILACHADQSLAVLADASDGEREMLGAVPYQENDAVLHTDERLLPRSRRAWAAWNYLVPENPKGSVAVTYNMNLLQGLTAPVTFCMTLNRSDEIDPARVLRRIRYAHPLFGPRSLAAQRQRLETNGQNRTWFAGAWCGHGFHEDGVESARAITRRFGVDL